LTGTHKAGVLRKTRGVKLDVAEADEQVTHDSLRNLGVYPYVQGSLSYGWSEAEDEDDY